MATKTRKKAAASRKMPVHARLLRRLGACEPAVAFARKYKTANAAWKACEDIDWLLWIIRKQVQRETRDEPPNGIPGLARRRFALCLCDMAMLARKSLTVREKQVVDAVRRWARSKLEYGAVQRTTDEWDFSQMAVNLIRVARWGDRPSCFDTSVTALVSERSEVYVSQDAISHKLTPKMVAIVKKHYPKCPNINASKS